MNFSVVITSYLLARSFFNFKNLTDNLLVFFILFFVQIILTLELLGFFSLLVLNNILIINLVALLATYILSRRKINSGKGRPLFKNSYLISGGQLGISESIILSIILGFLILKIIINLINPPLGWDSLNYHFTFPVEWLKSHTLANPLVVSDDPFPSYYPINGSLFFFWLILPFKNAFLADLGQLPFWVVSFLAVFGICKKLRVSREFSFLAASLFVFMPNVFKQLQIAYVDIMVGGMYLAALNFLISIYEKRNIISVIMFSITCGILIGIKSTALSYGILIVLPFIFMVILGQWIKLQTKFIYLSIFILSLLIFGAYGYLRNIILTGNPLYPLHLTFFGKTLLKGVIDKATFTYRNQESGYSLLKLLFHEGLGAQTLLIILPATFLALPVNLIKNKNRDIFFNYIMLLPLLSFLVFRFALPIPNARYLYPMLGAGIVVGFYLLYSLHLPLKIARTASVIFIITCAFENARRLELGLSFGLAILIFALIVYLLRVRKLNLTLISKWGLILFIIATLIALPFLLKDYEKNEYARYIKNSRYWPDATAAWDWLNKETKGNNIAYVGKPLPYPLYGTNFKNNVYYVSVNKIDPIHLHDLRGSNYRWRSVQDDAIQMHKSFEEPDNYRGHADYSVWLKNLDRRKTDFLFLYTLNHVKTAIFPIEEEWARVHPKEFTLVFSNPTVRIYKIKK